MIPIFALDNEPQMAPKAYGPISVYGGTPDDLDSMVKGDARVGARSFTYRGGNFMVYSYVGPKGCHGWLAKLLFECGIGMFGSQVNYGNSCMATNSWLRCTAIRECKRWIEKQ